MTKKICPSCNEQVSDDAKFCALCGAALDDNMRDVEIALDQDKNICPACGVAYIQEATSCPNCGNKLKIAAPQPKKKLLSAIWCRLSRRR